MTLDGTNSYVVDCGDGAALVIDPGPPIAAHVESLQRAAEERGLRIVAIAVTHGHPDHAPAAAPLARATGASIYAHPNGAIARDAGRNGNKFSALVLGVVRSKPFQMNMKPDLNSINGGNTDNLGVTPDIKVAMTPADLQGGFQDYLKAVNAAVSAMAK
jgi:glyoxylase-like metal-dependent hydrolase (beta-lactamase superfamily II)